MIPRWSGIAATGMTAVLVVALSQPAAAAPAGSTVRLLPSGLVYTAADPALHDTLLTATDTTVTLTEFGPTPIQQPLPRGCTAAAVDGGGVVTDGGGTAVTCPLLGRRTVQVRYGSGDDFLDASAIPTRLSIDLFAGEGVNGAEAGFGDDVLVGGSGGDTFYGSSGRDVIRAGGGFNFVHGNSGTDLITTGDDLDIVYGDASDDVLTLGKEFNLAYGGAGDDLVTGGDDGDLLSGGSGNDVLTGRGGDDELNGGSGSDSLLGGPGDDLLRLRDGTADAASCSEGKDTARVDAGETDRLDRSCESVVRYDPAVADPEDENDIIDESVEEAVDQVDVHSGYPKGWHRALWHLALRHHARG